MRLPDIPQRHRLLVRSVATIGTGALSIVRRRDFAAEHRTAARAAYAAATAALTWLSGTKAFADQHVDGSGLRDLSGSDADAAAEPVRYATADGEPTGALRCIACSEDADAWWVDDATWRSQAFFNLAAAAAAGAASWMLWGPIQNLKDTWDAKLPDGVGRGLGAAVNSSFMAASAFAFDKLADWTAHEATGDGYATVEIELPTRIRASVEALLDQPHPIGRGLAEVIRAQVERARYFVWVGYSEEQFPGDGPIELSDEDLRTMLAEETVSRIEVYHDTDVPKAIPGTQTYPVIGVVEPGRHEAGDSASSVGSPDLELRLEISEGLLTCIELVGTEDDDDDPDAVARVAERLGASAPGTLHPGGVDSVSEGEGDGEAIVIDFDADEPFGPRTTLADWPSPHELSFRTDRA